MQQFTSIAMAEPAGKAQHRESTTTHTNHSRT